MLWCSLAVITLCISTVQQRDVLGVRPHFVLRFRASPCKSVLKTGTPVENGNLTRMKGV